MGARPASAPAGTTVPGVSLTVCLQIALTCTQIWWTTEVGLAFARLEEGYESAIKDYNKKQVRSFEALPLLPVGQKRPNLSPLRPPPQWFRPRVENGNTPLEIHSFLFFLVWKSASPQFVRVS